MRHEGAVDAFQRHHIADRGKGNQIEQAEQVRLFCVLVETFAAQHANCRHEKQKHDTGSSEMALAGEIILAVRIDHREGWRERLVGLVVINHDNLHPGVIGGNDCRFGGGAAIDREDEACPLLRQPGARQRCRSVALCKSVRDVSGACLAVRPQEPLDQGNGGPPIHVIVAKYGDSLARPDSVREAFRGSLHVLQPQWVRKQCAQRWIEIGVDRLGVGATGGKHAAKQFRQPLGLGDGHGDHFPPWFEAFNPTAATGGVLNAKHRRRAVVFVTFCRVCHAGHSHRSMSGPASLPDSTPKLRQANLLTSGWTVLIQRTVRVDARITTL